LQGIPLTIPNFSGYSSFSELKCNNFRSGEDQGEEWQAVLQSGVILENYTRRDCFRFKRSFKYFLIDES